MKISLCNKVFLGFAFVTSITEIICTMVYQFHALGFTAGLLCFVCTPVLYFLFFDTKKTEPEIIGDNHEDFKENFNTGIENSSERQWEPTWLKKLFWVLYCIFVVMLFLLTFLRIFVLCRRTEWRSDLNDEFPTECGEWAAAAGCTRLVMEKESMKGGCVKTGDLASEYEIVFEVDGDKSLNGNIQTCIDNTPGAKLHSPSTIDQIDTLLPQVHVTFQSSFFGFIDDMYIKTSDNNLHVGSRTVSMQSQLRLGSSDFD